MYTPASSLTEVWAPEDNAANALAKTLVLVVPAGARVQLTDPTPIAEKEGKKDVRNARFETRRYLRTKFVIDSFPLVRARARPWRARACKAGSDLLLAGGVGHIEKKSVY